MDEKTELAIDIVVNQIAELMNKFTYEKNKEESSKLKEKIDVLEKVKDELYKNNESLVNSVLDKAKKGSL